MWVFLSSLAFNVPDFPFLFAAGHKFWRLFLFQMWGLRSWILLFDYCDLCFSALLTDLFMWLHFGVQIKWICPTAPSRPISLFGGFPSTACEFNEPFLMLYWPCWNHRTTCQLSHVRRPLFSIISSGWSLLLTLAPWLQFLLSNLYEHRSTF